MTKLQKQTSEPQQYFSIGCNAITKHLLKESKRDAGQRSFVNYFLANFSRTLSMYSDMFAMFCCLRRLALRIIVVFWQAPVSEEVYL
mmetsp:Transcript_15929/g.19757  ORF Transcript_15929/g.19757 Transcript_15929/m.19757 type:complete len:87 (-) Transcript_15929:157-417(-)